MLYLRRTSMKKIVYIEVGTTDPTFNLALEEYVFEHMPRENEYFLTWRNDNAIIIGRHQNTVAEINEEFVRERGIRVVRRLSGGGAVYHDLGNLNFTFIVDAEQGQKVDLRRFCQPIADTLCALGANATVDGRNDILIDGKKISGNAQYVRQGRVMHHGTILFDSDMSVLDPALKPDPAKMQNKGVKSVRSRVTNVRPCLREDMTIEQFRTALTQSLFRGDDFVRYELTDTDIAAITEIQKQRYALHEWNYGFCEAAQITHKRRFEGCGSVEAHISTENAKITSLRFHGDYFSTLPTEELAAKLIGKPLAKDALLTALDGIPVSDYITGLSRDDLVALLLD
ncbi:MAG: lipoate--protein ligase [Ruminococcaceae bacterium]|nr:lipoate--protein ligase [Oscillospiraceae bacterium]